MKSPLSISELTISPAQPQSLKLTSILEYLGQYGDADVAYDDLRPFAERLVLDERIHLVKTLILNGLENVDTEIPVLKSLCIKNEDVSG